MFWSRSLNIIAQFCFCSKSMNLGLMRLISWKDHTGVSYCSAINYKELLNTTGATEWSLVLYISFGGIIYSFYLALSCCIWRFGCYIFAHSYITVFICPCVSACLQGGLDVSWMHGKWFPGAINVEGLHLSSLILKFL